ncbi:hypothetical protein LTR78_009874 [Recurvomyces mirabilis]|uniref:rRNA-processing protein EFG1 n=1 Tax=Recurvomyces mirabilis TaxID=574656 RepID=A0AAE0TNR8_9PEZI|nr:hypothetical protein LTR78_009874 [Recurvomyces mirabilis]KAK5150549.1 hypothetical protein LTS14_010043 [Recurvomyces mirabilis]
MSNKRPRDEPHTHPSRLALVPPDSNQQRPTKRPRKEKPAHIKGASFKKAHTVHDLKARIRSLRRGLEHNDALPATIREEKERALRSAETELGETERRKRRSEVIGRWHKVRFFERQRAGKRVKFLRKRVQEVAEAERGGGGEARGVLERLLGEAEVDVMYAVYFPLEREYVPLFPRKKKMDGDRDETAGGSPEADGEAKEGFTRLGDREMWERVRQCVVDGTLEALREGKLDQAEDVADSRVVERLEIQKKKNRKDGAKDAVPKKTKSQQKALAKAELVVGNRRERRKAAAAAAPLESDDGSDAGFFDEG